jgi:hypothetical protein
MRNHTELSPGLQETERIREWAVSKVPSARLLEPPPNSRHPQPEKCFKTYFGEWPALRKLFHLAFDEETQAAGDAALYWRPTPLGGPSPPRART